MILKKDKMNGIIQRELSQIIQVEVRDPKIGFVLLLQLIRLLIYQLLKYM